MDLSIFQIAVLAAVQGAAELLPVSSSAHVIVAEKLMGLDPTTPAMTLLLVMLHTGTMFAAIVYFWKDWRITYFSSVRGFFQNAGRVVMATAITGVSGLALLQAIKVIFLGNAVGFEVEHLFGNSVLMAVALAMAGLLILLSARLPEGPLHDISLSRAAWIGAVQGLCLPFRGFSRSGATISCAMILGISRRKAEEFSFALAVALTPAVVLREAHRLYRTTAVAISGHESSFLSAMKPGLLGMLLSFGIGIFALRWLTAWIEGGQWRLFGVYCLAASMVVLWVG